ncbi:hypothetical protein [Curtobacterium sp. MCBD17_032]|uniref:hypothetical protein n=1 Tax=Curtobacterium sp. MCBD17_032 TaxID=2175659 RepID=UPI000DA88FB4|nr:hypothetical protein [Curtobacterium sp. MCBD17_032]PZE80219.1 hypothetical protein DEI91_14690 [Curtobacterium sp. MCBD17_032]
MTPVRIGITVLAAAFGAGLVIALIAAGSVALAVGTAADVHVPGLIDVTAGAGDDLASASFGSGVLLWFGGIAAGLTGAGLVRPWLARRSTASWPRRDA